MTFALAALIAWLWLGSLGLVVWFFQGATSKPTPPHPYLLEDLRFVAHDGRCPVCHTVNEVTCPDCGREYKSGDTYCLECGHIRQHGGSSVSGY